MEVDDFGYGSKRGAGAAWGLLGGVFLLWLSLGLKDATGTGGWFAGLAGLLGTVALVIGGMQAVLYAVERWLEVDERRRINQSISPRSRIIEAVARLTAEQAALIPGLDYRSVEVDVVDGHDQMLFFLVTPEARVPFTWLKDYLGDCGVTWLRPIRSYSEGTPGYEYARAFTHWCIGKGYALEASGNNPAQWSSEQVKSGLMKRFGFEGEDGLQI